MLGDAEGEALVATIKRLLHRCFVESKGEGASRSRRAGQIARRDRDRAVQGVFEMPIPRLRDSAAASRFTSRRLGQLGQALHDPGLQRLGFSEGNAVSFCAGKHVVGQGARA